jgi:hypothetical protein
MFSSYLVAVTITDDRSWWVAAFTASGVVPSGVVESFLKASHMTRARHVHHMTGAALYSLLRQAYQKYKLPVLKTISTSKSDIQS